MLFFFSNRLGCLGSPLVSAVVAVVRLFAFGMLRLRLVEIRLSQRTTAGDRYPMSKEALMIPPTDGLGYAGIASIGSARMRRFYFNLVQHDQVEPRGRAWSFNSAAQTLRSGEPQMACDTLQGKRSRADSRSHREGRGGFHGKKTSVGGRKYYRASKEIVRPRHNLRLHVGRPPQPTHPGFDANGSSILSLQFGLLHLWDPSVPLLSRARTAYRLLFTPSRAWKFLRPTAARPVVRHDRTPQDDRGHIRDQRDSPPPDRSVVRSRASDRSNPDSRMADDLLFCFGGREFSLSHGERDISSGNEGAGDCLLLRVGDCDRGKPFAASVWLAD